MNGDAGFYERRGHSDYAATCRWVHIMSIYGYGIAGLAWLVPEFPDKRSGTLGSWSVELYSPGCIRELQRRFPGGSSSGACHRMVTERNAV